MTLRWWLIGLAGAACMMGSMGTANAQTVIVRHVAGQTKVDARVGSGAPVVATTDADGNARIVLHAVQGADLSAHVLVDVCASPSERHILIVGLQMTAAAVTSGCARKTVGSVFVIRDTTTLVIDMLPETPTVLIAQGTPPSEWLEDRGQQAAGASATVQPTGIMVFGTGGLTTFGSFGSADCGQNTSNCTSHATKPAATAGAAYWFTPHVAAVVSYTRTRAALANGNGSNYTFTSRLETNVLTVGGQIMASAHHVTFFGRVGGAHHRARWLTSQTTDPTTVTVDGVDQVLQGGTESWDVRTTGWNWSVGAGADFWVSSRVAIVTAFQFAVLKGTDLGGSEAAIDERAPSVQAGLLLRLGGA